MDFEDHITALFDSATATLRPPVDEIAEQSAAQGRRLHRRRRTAKAALGACGATAIVCGTAFGVVHASSPHRSAALASGTGAASASSTGSTGSTGSTSPGSTPRAGDGSGTPTGATSPSTAAAGTDFQLLQSLLPAGARLTPMPYAWGGTVPGAADAVYQDGHGEAEISVTAFQHSRIATTTCATWTGGKDEGPRPAGATPVSCATVRLPNGDTRTTLVSGADEHGFYDYEVTLARTDGSIVIATAANGVPEGADVVVTRAVPPLTLAQLQALAADPGWQVT